MGKEKLFSDRISIYFSNESLRSAVISFSSLLLPASFLAYRRVNLTIATPFQLKYNFFLKRKKKKRADRRAGSWNWINVTALLTVTCVRSTGQWENEANRQREREKKKIIKLPTDLTTERYSHTSKENETRETYIVTLRMILHQSLYDELSNSSTWIVFFRERKERKSMTHVSPNKK